MPLHLASALLNINEQFDLDDRRKSPDRSGIQMSTNKPSATGQINLPAKGLSNTRSRPFCKMAAILAPGGLCNGPMSKNLPSGMS